MTEFRKNGFAKKTAIEPPSFSFISSWWKGSPWRSVEDPKVKPVGRWFVDVSWFSPVQCVQCVQKPNHYRIMVILGEFRKQGNKSEISQVLVKQGHMWTKEIRVDIGHSKFNIRNLTFEIHNSKFNILLGGTSSMESESFISEIVCLVSFYCQCLIRPCRREYSRINLRINSASECSRKTWPIQYNIWHLILLAKTKTGVAEEGGSTKIVIFCEDQKSSLA